MDIILSKFKLLTVIALIIFLLFLVWVLIYGLLIKKYELSVSTLPEGAKISIDNKDTGDTPVKFKLHPGKHKLKITEDNFVTIEDNIDLQKNTQKLYTLTSQNKANFEKLLEKLPIKTPDYWLIKSNNNLFVTFRNVPIALYKNKVLEFLKSEGINPTDPSIEIIWNTPAYLR